MVRAVRVLAQRRARKAERRLVRQRQIVVAQRLLLATHAHALARHQVVVAHRPAQRHRAVAARVVQGLVPVAEAIRQAVVARRLAHVRPRVLALVATRQVVRRLLLEVLLQAEVVRQEVQVRLVARAAVLLEAEVVGSIRRC